MYTINVKFFAVVSSFIISCSVCQAQPNQRAMLDSIAGNLMREIRSDQSDRIYMHYDKPYYQSGTSIWFRVYLLNDLSGRISGNQSNIYVTLTNDKDSCISQAILNSVNREWDGALAIPGKTPEGFYTIRAFTRQMAKVVSNKSFSAQIYILNKKSVANNYSFPETIDVSVKSDALLHFYPEGGSLVNGIDNLVAFEALDATGHPQAIQGRLIDDNQKIITSISTDKNGKGTMIFVPVKNRTYTAVIKSMSGSDLKFTLSPINYKACQLNIVSQTDKKIRLRVVLGDSLYAKKPVSFIVGVAKDKLCFAGIGNGMYETDVSLANFPSGPAIFYLYDENQMKQSERRVFIEKKDINLLIQADKENYSPREKVNITLKLSDPEGKPIQSLLSVSVTDDSLVEWPMLSAGKKNISGRDSVDLLKKLPEAIDTTMNNPDPGDTGIILSGIIKDSEGAPREGQVITFVEDGNNFILSDTTDASGLFSFPPFNFTDQTPFFTQVTDLNKVKQHVVITNSLPFSLPTAEYPENIRWTAFPQGIHKFRQVEADSLITGTLKNALEILVHKEKKSVKKDKYNVSERNAATVVLTGEQLDKLGQGNTYNAILLLQGVQIRKGKLTIRDGTESTNSSSGEIEPLLIEDGVPVVSSSVSLYLNSLPPQNIEYIKIIRGIEAMRYGNRASNGVILVKTANILRTQTSAVQVGIQYIFPVGYQKKQTFYMPPYESNSVREASFKDNRATIYWNGEMLTDSQGMATFQFNTADSPSTYSIRIRGVSSKGDIIDETVKINRN